jgi:hypothetical protein
MANTLGERSAGDILRDVVNDIGEIVRGEIRLAVTELREKGARAGKAGGFLAGAALCGMLASASLVAACIAGLAHAMPVWLAALLMWLILLCAAGAFYAGARSRLKQIDPVPHRTVETAKETLEWAKHRTT